jgi:hypothetical protein
LAAKCGGPTGGWGVAQNLVNCSYDIFYANLRFNQITVGTESLAASTLIFAGKRGHHNYLYIFCFGGRTKNVEHVEAANFWHHNIADDKLRALFNCHSKRFFPIAR